MLRAVDSYEFAQLKPSLKLSDIEPNLASLTPAVADVPDFEARPHFHQWATVLPGMICLTRKARNATFRNYVASETATPVIGAAAGLTHDDAKNFFFAGICRSKTVRQIDDGNGPSVDEFFTLSIGGMATILNNSKTPVFPGDMIEWTLYSENPQKASGVRIQQDVRRVGIKIASPVSERVIGRCLSFAKSGEPFDLLIKAA